MRALRATEVDRASGTELLLPKRVRHLFLIVVLALTTISGPASAQQVIGGLRDYRCLYRTARLLYRATLVVTPRPNAAGNGDQR